MRATVSSIASEAAPTADGPPRLCAVVVSVEQEGRTAEEVVFETTDVHNAERACDLLLRAGAKARLERY